MSKHNPGPWTVEVGDTETSIESKYFTIASDVSNEDADLIAAAPDLFTALKSLVDFNCRYEGGELMDLQDVEFNMKALMEAAAQAIKKAEGRK